MNDIKNHILNSKAAKHWEKIGIYPHHGVLIPLFALHTKKSSGIGEYLDLLQVIDWLSSVGFDVLQLLPLNETGKDPSPYNAITSTGLNPIHISLHALKGVDDNRNLKNKLKEFKIYNSYHMVHYFALKKAKMDFLYEYYKYVFDDLKKDKEFNSFLENNSWLDEYALFKAIQEKQSYKVWEKWPDSEKNPTKENLNYLLEKYKIDIHFYKALQYFSFNQLKEVKEHADKKHIKILGDIPIMVSKNSCDVWFHKDIFDDSLVAGAPPDSYSIYGQKWGFPLFNWKRLKESNYKWWERRLRLIENFYHMYRIDHTVGFFRIWAMHINEDATQGRFLPRDPALWKKNGTERLEMMLSATELLPIAEDLGLIPKVVYSTLYDLGICGTKVVPWEKTKLGFIKFKDYIPLSLSTLSTHDSDTFQQWWEEYQKGSLKFAKFMKWDYKRILSYSHRKELLHDIHHTPSLFHINLFQEYLNLYKELSWEDIDDERINIPGTMLPTNWTYRYKTSFEEIANHKKFAQDIKDILKN